MGGRQSNSTYQYTLTSDNVADLRAWAPKLAEAMKARSDVMTDVDTDQSRERRRDLRRPSTATAPRAWASRPRAVDNALYNAFGQRQIATIYEDINQYARDHGSGARTRDPEALSRSALKRHVHVPTRAGAATSAPTAAHQRRGGQSRPARPSSGSALSTGGDHRWRRCRAIASVLRGRHARPRSTTRTASWPRRCRSTWPTGSRSATPRRPIKQAEADIGLPDNVRGSFAGTARSVQD